MTPDSLARRLAEFPRFPLLRGDTPIHRLDNLSGRLGIDLWVKRDDLTGLAAGGNKARKLEYLVGHALAQGADLLLTAGWYHSNHALQTAAAAARARLDCILFLKAGDPRKGSLFLDQLCGADVRHYPVSGSACLGPIMATTAEELRRAGRVPWVIPVGGSDAIGALGYVAAALELRRQLDQAGWEPELVICPTSSGGTQAGLVCGLSVLFPRTALLGIGVGDDPPPLAAKVRQLVGELRARLELPSPAGPLGEPDFRFDYGFGAYGLLAGPVLDLIAEVGAREGIFLDPIYTGKAFYGLVRLVEQGQVPRDARVLFLHSGGLGGLFQYEEEIHAHLTRLGGPAEHWPVPSDA